MGESLNRGQIEKYAARLQGKRLLPIFKDLQLKRAILRLAADGTRRSLDAIQDGVTKGLLSMPPYATVLDDVLAEQLNSAAAMRVRVHLKNLERRQQKTPKQSASAASVPPEHASSETKTAPPRHEIPPKDETFASTSDPIELLKQCLGKSTSSILYRAELKQRVHGDSSKQLLQQICELWDKSSDPQKGALRDLLEFIELVPERPLWLRRDVALDCGMPWQLADDSPAIAKHLVTKVQLLTRKEAILNLIRKLRREDTKAEICSLWYDQHRQGNSNPDFVDVLREQGYLPTSPLEQRVAIALTCGWAERLVFDEREILSVVLPLRDHPTLGQEAEKVLANLKNPTTLKAFRELTSATLNVAEESEPEQNSKNDKNVVSTCDAEKDKKSELADADTISTTVRPVQQVEGTDSISEPVAPPTRNNSNLAAKSFNEPNHHAEDDEFLPKSSLDSTAWDDGSLNQQSLANIDRLANLSSDERQRIISSLVQESSDDDDCIDDLLTKEMPLPSDPGIDVQQGSKPPTSSLPVLEVNKTDDISDPRESPEGKDEEEVASRFKVLLRRNGFALAFNSGYAIISSRINGLQTEIVRIELHELLRLSKTERKLYVKDCSARLLECMVEKDRTELTSEQPNIIVAEKKISSYSGLNIEHFDEDVLDSASVALINCASDLINQKISHHLAPFCELTAGLLVFHTREKDAEVKSYNERLVMNEDALLKDSDCIVRAKLEDIVPLKEGLFAARYIFDPQQPFRFSTQGGQSKVSVICQTSKALLSIASVDETKGIATAHVKENIKARLPGYSNLIHIPQDFSFSLRQNLAKQAREWTQDHSPLPAAFVHLLTRSGSSEITKLNQKIEKNPSNTAALISGFLGASDGISLVIQGPPGSGKTTCAAEIIVSLAQNDFKIGVSAQSHLAIDILMAKAATISKAKGHETRFAKFKSSVTSQERKELSARGIQIIDIRTFNVLHDVYGGTAHAFSGSLFDELFDLLIIDEASQVSLASLLAMARSARNLLLVGDQQQLPQPIIAEHPGECGLSCLSYATNCQQLVPNNIGVFLSKSWRMHPRVCGFISDTFYEGKLGFHGQNEVNKLTSISSGNGILYIPVDHESNHVFSPQEADSIKSICAALLGLECQITGKDENKRFVIGWQDIAIMAPYNAQVSLLQRALGPEARVGTVDKFQGQEAPVAIYSMTSSNAENPGAIEFVLNRNRVNVAISRSQCLSIVVGSPSLLNILNNSPELRASRELFVSLSEFVGSAKSLSPGSTSSGISKVTTIDDPHGILRIEGLQHSSDQPLVPIPDDLAHPLNNKLARKLFKFDLCSDEILDLYKCRLFDELCLFLDFCRWDETEKAWERTKVLLRLANSPISTPMVLEKLAKRGDAKIRQAVAANPRTSLSVVKQLIARESVMGRRGAAENPSLPSDLYHDLFHSSADELTHRALAHNPSTPDEILLELADSEYELTREAVTATMANRAIKSSMKPQDEDRNGSQAEAFSLLHDSPLELAKNPLVPASVLSTLVSSVDQRIRTALASNPSLAIRDIQSLALDTNDSVRCQLALRPELPPQVSSEMAFDKSRFVRRNLASNPSCSESAFKRLAADKDVYVRENLASNPALTSKASSWLLAESESRVYLALADNVSVGADVFIEAQRAYYSDSFVGNKEAAIKALLLMHPNCPISHLQNIQIIKDLPIRLALALGAHSTVRVLESLVNDEDKQIAQIAKRRLSD